jgi:hypothetical protein
MRFNINEIDLRGEKLKQDMMDFESDKRILNSKMAKVQKKIDFLERELEGN